MFQFTSKNGYTIKIYLEDLISASGDFIRKDFVKLFEECKAETLFTSHCLHHPSVFGYRHSGNT